MKPILTILLLLPLTVISQDLLYKFSGEKVNGKVIRITRDSVYYRDHERGDTSKVISKRELISLSMANGVTMNFSERQSVIPDSTGTASDFQQGRADATVHYDNYKPAGTATLVTSIIFPMLGLIPAIACSSTAPDRKNLGMPDPSRGQNSEYLAGYTQQARKIKSKKVWKNYGIGAGIGVGWRVAYIIAIVALVTSIEG
jgi:hypothetical protein